MEGNKRANNVSDEEFASIVASSLSIAECLRKIGISPTAGGNYDRLRKRVTRLSLDINHWTGQAYRKGSHCWDGSIQLQEALVKNSKYDPRRHQSLKARLIRAKLLKNECSQCGLTLWQNKPITLELDHINGENRDYRIENLRLLCPNCHAQTDTYCRGKKKSPP